MGAAREEKMKAERKRSAAVLRGEEGRQTSGRVCGKIRREGRILQASKTADEHVCRGAVKSTAAWRAERCGCFRATLCSWLIWASQRLVFRNAEYRADWDQSAPF